VIPRELVQRMKAAEEYGKGIQARVQMFYAALSLELYRRAPQGLDSTGLVAELQNRFSPFRYVEGTHFHCSFGHLDGYSAGYYTYMWSQVIAKDLLSAFHATHLMDTATARRYRDRVLAPGGSRDAADLVSDFLGRPYDERAFGQWLNGA
jgi:thimet oligopeptidase